jgi:hypothetical protein
VRNAYYHFAQQRHTDVWIALGDNGYFYGNDYEYQTNFFAVYPALFRQTAIWSAIGNHETWSVAAGNRIPYLDIFSFPTNGEAGGIPSGAEEYYSFDYANIHFVCLDSMTSSRATNGPMATWLRSDLAANTLPWVIAFWHHAPYSKGSHDSDDPYEVEMIEMRQNIVPVIEEYGVDLVLNGHCHKYERSFLLRGHYGDSKTLRADMILDRGSGRMNDTGPYIKPTSGPLANQGTVYVEVGCSGSIDTPTGRHPAIAFEELHRGSLVIDIDQNRLDVAFLRDTGAIGDSFTLIKGEPEPLRLCNLVLQNGQAIVRWKSTRGERYQVERSTNDQSLGWEPASDPITATGATSFWTNTVAADPMRLYRVVRLAPQ